MMQKISTFGVIRLIEFVTDKKFVKQGSVQAFDDESITFEMKDVNAMVYISGESMVSWERYIKEMFPEYEADRISFEYGDGNWVTIKF